MNRLLDFVITALLLSAPLTASATTTPLPEPGSWALVGIGLVAAIVVKVRNRRK